MSVHTLACRYLDAGISLIPISLTGSKAPAAALLPKLWDADRCAYRPSWKPFQQRLVDPGTARAWWIVPEPPGLAAVCGRVSGGLELIDFDAQWTRTWLPWAELVHEEHPGLVERLAVVQTPKGRHAWYFCPDLPAVPGNQKLAVMPCPTPEHPQAREVLVETRGEGGYALLPGCPLSCHPTGLPYTYAGPIALWDRPTVTSEERDCLVRCARLFDRAPPAEDPAPGRLDLSGVHLPGSDYDLRGPDWADILTPHGWALARTVGEERLWRRPGKDRGWSASTGFCRGRDGADLLRVWSSNAAPFEDGKAYGKFRALALLSHGGDWSACARECRHLGYGALTTQERVRHNVPRRPTREEMERVVMVLIDCPEEVRAALRELGVIFRGDSHG